MKISVVTVTYNSEAALPKTLDSLAQQKQSKEYTAECLIIDGASKDRTVEVAESYREKLSQAGIELRIVSEPDGGIYDAMNKGASLAVGEVVGFLNSGDWYEPETLETVAETFKSEDLDLMYGNIRLYKTNGESFIKKARLRKFQTSRDWNHPTTFVRTKLMQEYPFRKLGIHDDYGFFLQMKKQNRSIRIVDRTLANFTMGGASNHRSLRAARKRIRDRYKYCYRINGYSRWYLVECLAIEAAKMLLG